MAVSLNQIIIIVIIHVLNRIVEIRSGWLHQIFQGRELTQRFLCVALKLQVSESEHLWNSCRDNKFHKINWCGGKKKVRVNHSSGQLCIADVRLNPDLLKDCKADISLYCKQEMERAKNSNVDAEGIVLTCLRNVFSHKVQVVSLFDC